jgi:3-hydroxybutyryl-CoA dehydrogenase
LNVRTVGIVAPAPWARGSPSPAPPRVWTSWCGSGRRRRPSGALAEIADCLDRDIARWSRTESEKKAVLSRIKTVADLAALEAAQIVIESVSEDLALKSSIFQELDRACPPEDILATNTSALSVTEIGARTRRPDRVIGLHFLQPVPRVPLVEVVRGLATSDATFQSVLEFVRLIGKTGVEVFEYPGYITTRRDPALPERGHVRGHGGRGHGGGGGHVDEARLRPAGGPAGPGRPDGPRRGHALDAAPVHGAGGREIPSVPAAAQDDPRRAPGREVGQGFFEYDEHGQIKKG